MLFLKRFSLRFGIFEERKKLTKELFFFPLASLLECLLFPLQLFPFLLYSPSKNQAFQMLMTWDFLFLFGLFNFEELHPSLSSESLLSEFNPSSGVEDRVEDEEELPQEV